MPIWGIMMGTQLTIFVISGVWVLAWMRGKEDIYDKHLSEVSAINERKRQKDYEDKHGNTTAS